MLFISFRKSLCSSAPSLPGGRSSARSTRPPSAAVVGTMELVENTTSQTGEKLEPAAAVDNNTPATVAREIPASSSGDTGTWEVDGNLLTFYNGDEEIRTRYFLSTNELVLNFSLLEIVELTEDFDDDREFFAAVYEEDASFQIIFRRVE